MIYVIDITLTDKKCNLRLYIDKIKLDDKFTDMLSQNKPNGSYTTIYVNII